MQIKDLKKELGLKDKDLAEFFGLEPHIFYRSSARKRYEQAFIKIYDFLKARGEKNNRITPTDTD
jgi:hypothetical protein